jgi:hypothetical protein
VGGIQTAYQNAKGGQRLYEGKEPFRRNKDVAMQKPLLSIERPTAHCRFGVCGIGANEK